MTPKDMVHLILDNPSLRNDREVLEWFSEWWMNNHNLPIPGDDDERYYTMSIDEDLEVEFKLKFLYNE